MLADVCTIRAGARLRELLRGPDILVAPGAYDPWSARLVERHRFRAVYMSGYGASASVLGAPDLGLMTAAEMAGQVRRIADATRIPVIADADTGFGGTLNVVRTVRDYIAAGAGAIQLEDQVSPKRCGHMENKQVVEPAVMCERIRAAVRARGDDPLVIIARTDARATHGLDDALRRVERYLAAGADMLFVEAPRSEEEMRRICETFRGVPQLANMVEAGKTPYLPAKTLQQIGYALAIFPVTLLFAATRAIDYALAELQLSGRVTETALTDFPHFNEMMGLPDYFAFDASIREEVEAPTNPTPARQPQ